MFKFRQVTRFNVTQLEIKGLNKVLTVRLLLFAEFKRPLQLKHLFVDETLGHLDLKVVFSLARYRTIRVGRGAAPAVQVLPCLFSPSQHALHRLFQGISLSLLLEASSHDSFLLSEQITTSPAAT